MVPGVLIRSILPPLGSATFLAVPHSALRSGWRAGHKPNGSWRFVKEQKRHGCRVFIHLPDQRKLISDKAYTCIIEKETARVNFSVNNSAPIFRLWYNI
jgi:hypothetical protein